MIDLRVVLDERPSWTVARDGAWVAHAFDPRTRSSACGLRWFTELEQDDWRQASGILCVACRLEVA